MSEAVSGIRVCVVKDVFIGWARYEDSRVLIRTWTCIFARKLAYIWSSRSCGRKNSNCVLDSRAIAVGCRFQEVYMGRDASSRVQLFVHAQVLERNWPKPNIPQLVTSMLTILICMFSNNIVSFISFCRLSQLGATRIYVKLAPPSTTSTKISEMVSNWCSCSKSYPVKRYQNQTEAKCDFIKSPTSTKRWTSSRAKAWSWYPLELKVSLVWKRIFWEFTF